MKEQVRTKNSNGVTKEAKREPTACINSHVSARSSSAKSSNQVSKSVSEIASVTSSSPINASSTQLIIFQPVTGVDALKTRLLAALRIAQPTIGKAYLYERCVNKYVDVMLPALRSAIAFKPADHLLPHQFHFQQSSVRELIGTIGKSQRYIEQVMKADESTSLVLVERKGFNKNGKAEPSIVRLNPIYEDLIVDAILDLHIEANQKLLEEIERTANYWVPIDRSLLRAFIDKTAETLRTSKKNGNYEAALLRNLAAAQQLLSMTHDADERFSTPYVAERWEQSDSGRIFGQGYSLQRLPKEVRHAALGVCHKYDFKASAFALMAGLAHGIDPTLRVGAVLDYVKQRAKIRERIASRLNISESLVKTIFSAIGFGAELKNNQHNAIRGALAKAARQKHDLNVRLDKETYNNLGEDEYQRLIADPTFRFIYEEFQAINDTILAHYKNRQLVIGGNVYQPINPKTGKKRTDRQKLAWIYQALESQAMFMFDDLAQKWAGQEAILTTHDCLYFKQQLSAEQVKDIASELQQHFPYLRFEHEKIYPITGDEENEARSAETKDFERQHKLWIAEETERAKPPTLRSEREPIYTMAGDEEYEADCADYWMDEVEQKAWLREQESLAIYHRLSHKIRKLFDLTLGA